MRNIHNNNKRNGKEDENEIKKIRGNIKGKKNN